MLPVNSLIGLLSEVANPAHIEDVMNNGMTLGERLSYGMQMTGIGLLTIFAVLGIIYITMLLFRVVFYDIPNRRKQKGKAEPTPAAAPAPTPAAPIPAAPAQDDTMIAVLTAAVAAILADEAAANGTQPLPFRVVSFRRTAKGRGWNSKS